MITENVVILAPTMRETIEALTAKCIAEEYFGDHITAVRQDGDVDTIGHQVVRGCGYIWQFSDAEVEALLCAIDCCSAESEPDHIWLQRTKTVQYFDYDGEMRHMGLQAIIDHYLYYSHAILPGLFE